jgi:hypothetical protein
MQLLARQEMVALYRRFNGIVPFLPFTEKEQVRMTQHRAVFHYQDELAQQSCSFDRT